MLLHFVRCLPKLHTWTQPNKYCFYVRFTGEAAVVPGVRDDAVRLDIDRSRPRHTVGLKAI